MNTNNLITLNDVTKQFKKSDGSFVLALKDINLSFSNNGFVILLGENGSGKTTLLNLISGMDIPTKGTIQFHSAPYESISQEKLAALKSKSIGYVFQSDDLIGNDSVFSNISLSFDLQNRKADKNEIYNLLLGLGIDDPETFCNQKVNDLSGGQKQRVSIARALIKKPEVLLADEATAFLDREGKEDCLKILKEISKNILVIFATHQIEGTLQLADRIIELKSGTVFSDTFPSENVPKDDVKILENDSLSGNRFHLRFRRTLKFSLDFLSAKKMKWVLSSLLAFLSMFCFGIGLTGSMSNSLETELTMLNDNRISQVVIGSKNTVKVGSYPAADMDSGFTEKQLSVFSSFEKNEELSMVNEKTTYYSVRQKEEYSYFDYSKNIAFSLDALDGKTLDVYRLNYQGPFSGFLEVNPENNNLSWSKDSRLSENTICHLPDAFDEIAITSFKADMYLEYGYKNNEGQIVKINSLDELIGEKLDRFTICGIFETKEPVGLIKKCSSYNEKRFDGVLLKDLYLGGNFLSNYAIVKKGSYQNFVSQIDDGKTVFLNGSLVNLSNSISENKELFTDLSYGSNTNDFTSIVFEDANYEYSAKLKSPYSGIIEGTQSFQEGWINAAIWALSGILGLFSMIVLSMLLIMDFASKKRTLAILISLGASRKDILSICLTGSFVFGMIPLIVFYVFMPIACFFLNQFFYCDFFVFGLVQGLIVLGVVFAVTFLGTIIPLITLFKKKPIEILKEK